jgi:uncharacterized Tic20 family protein
MTTSPPPSSDRTWQVAAHLSALVMLVGIPSVVGPLVVWLVRRQDPAVEPHAREALNFHVSLLIYGFAATIAIVLLSIVLIGLILAIPVGLAFLAALIVFPIIGASRAGNGELYSYPFNLRLIR